MGYCNANGRVKGHLDEIKEIVHGKDYNLVTFVETNVRKEDKEPELDGFKGYFVKRAGREKREEELLHGSVTI